MGERGFLCTSSLEMSSFENVSPGMSPRFLSQKMAQKEPEKKIPSTTAKAISRSAKRFDSVIHRSALRQRRATLISVVQISEPTVGEGSSSRREQRG